jgi:hypothetical protein
MQVWEHKSGLVCGFPLSRDERAVREYGVSLGLHDRWDPGVSPLSQKSTAIAGDRRKLLGFARLPTSKA